LVELQFLNLILKSKDWGIVKKYRVDNSYFFVHKPVFEFMQNHYQRFSVVPDIYTIKEHFPDFEILSDVSESPEYLVQRLIEQKAYTTLVPFLKEVADLTKSSAVDAIQYLKSNLEKIARTINTTFISSNIVKNADERLQEFLNLYKNRDTLGISTGIKSLDDILHGFRAEELILLVARMGQGKTWVLLYLLIQAWMKGYRPLLFSLEMNRTAIGFRFDTLYAHFENSALMTGNLPEDVSRKDYEEYIKSLQDKSDFHVITAKDNQGASFTVDVIESLIDEYKPDIVGIDQLSLLSTITPYKSIREKYVEISRELKLLAERKGIPIILVVQANREFVKTRSKKNEDTPELHHIAESDAPAQNADKVISIRRVNSLLKLSVKKNRGGIEDVDVLLHWDINKGLFREMANIDEEMF